MTDLKQRIANLSPEKRALLERRLMEEDVLRQAEWSGPLSLLVPLEPDGSDPPIFFIHSASGGVLIYAELARHLGPHRPSYGLHAPDIDGKQTPPPEIEAMASHYVEQIRAMQPVGPYYLGGLCMGGIIAFEMAQQLWARGQRVAFLAFLDTPLKTPRNDLGEIVTRMGRLAYWGRRITHHLGRLVRLPPKEYLSYILGKGYVVKTLIMDPNRLRDAHHRAERRYVAKAYPGRITQFIPDDTPAGASRDRRLAWGELAGSGLEVHVVPGNQDSMMMEPHVQVLANQFKACLSRLGVNQTESKL